MLPRQLCCCSQGSAAHCCPVEWITGDPLITGLTAASLLQLLLSVLTFEAHPYNGLRGRGTALPGVPVGREGGFYPEAP